MTIPTLLQRPIKQMPSVLIYNPAGTAFYKMFNVNNSRYAGLMLARPVKDGGKDVLFIYLLIACQKRVGIGTKFIEFAKNLSKKLGCEGRIVLEADKTTFDPHNPPHIFYRKNGFTSDNKKMIKVIDKYIKEGKQLSYKCTPPLKMYYPEQPIDDVNFISKFFQKFRRSNV